MRVKAPLRERYLSLRPKWHNSIFLQTGQSSSQFDELAAVLEQIGTHRSVAKQVMNSDRSVRNSLTICAGSIAGRSCWLQRWSTSQRRRLSQLTEHLVSGTPSVRCAEEFWWTLMHELYQLCPKISWQSRQHCVGRCQICLSAHSNRPTVCTTNFCCFFIVNNLLFPVPLTLIFIRGPHNLKMR